MILCKSPQKLIINQRGKMAWLFYVINLKKRLPWNGLKYEPTFSSFDNQNLTTDFVYVTNVALHAVLLNKHLSGKSEGITSLAFLLQFQV